MDYFAVHSAVLVPVIAASGVFIEAVGEVNLLRSTGHKEAVTRLLGFENPAASGHC